MAEPENTAENQPEDNQAAPEAEEDFAGYGSFEAMKKAIYESRKEGKRLADHNSALAAQLQQVARMLPSEKSGNRSALDEINDLGLPAATFLQAVRDEIREELVKELAPMNATQTAVADLRANHPEFQKREPEFNKWLIANPDVADDFNKSVAESPRAARRLLLGAFAEFQQVRSAPPETKRVSPGGKLPSTQTTGSGRKAPDTGKMNKEEYREMIQEARRTGDPVALMRAMLGDKHVHRDFAKREE
jgi:hypothetical protein